MITYIPVLQKVFKTEALTIFEFILVTLASSVVYFAVEINKSFIRRRAGIGLRAAFI